MTTTSLKVFTVLALVVCFVIGTIVIGAEAGEKEILVGATLPLSGPAAAWGLPFQKSWNMVFEQWNAAGGTMIKGEKYTWRLVVYDDQMEGQKSVSNVERLVHRDKVKYIGVIGPDSHVAIQPTTTPAKVLTWGYAGMEPRTGMIGPNNPYSFSYGLDNLTVLHFYPWLAKKYPEIKKVAILSEEALNGSANIWSNALACKWAGLEVVFKEQADPEMTDFFPVLTKMLATKPDFLAIENWSPSATAIMIKQARELGFKGGFHLCTPDETLLREVAGWKNCEGIYIDPHRVDQSEVMKKWEADFKAKYSDKAWPGALGYLPYDFVHWLKQGIEGAQSTETDDIIKFWENNKMKSIWGEPCHLGGEKLFGIKRVPVYPMWFSQVQNGELVQVIANSFDPKLD